MDLLKRIESLNRKILIFKNTEQPTLLNEVEILLPIEKLKKIVLPKDGDDELYLPYTLNKEELKLINIEIGNVINIDLDKFFYILECTAVYRPDH